MRNPADLEDKWPCSGAGWRYSDENSGGSCGQILIFAGSRLVVASSNRHSLMNGWSKFVLSWNSVWGCLLLHYVSSTRFKWLLSGPSL